MDTSQCGDCAQKHDCKSIYEHLGKTQGPSIVMRVVSAFLVPLVLFIVSLAAWFETSSKLLKNEALRTLLGILAAVAVVGLYLLILTIARSAKNKSQR